MYIQNIAKAINKVTVNELRDFINYYKRIAFIKGGNYYSMKCWNREGLLLFPSKLRKNILVMLKNATSNSNS